MSESHEPTRLIVLAMRQGLISARQAMQSTIAYGGSQSEQTSFDLEAFWVEQEWVTPAQFAALSEELEGPSEESRLLKTMDEETLAITTLNQTLISLTPKGPISEEFLPPVNLRDPKTPPMGDLQRPPTGEAFEEYEGDHDLAHLRERVLAWRPKRDPKKRYKLGKELGRGGLGKVVEIYDLNLGRKVARKTLLAGNEASPNEIAYFIAEARLAGQLEHPNIIPIYEIGTLEDDQLYYTMRLLPPNDLEGALRERKYTLIQLIKILQQVCMGLEYAHQMGVIHRDIKPSNILLGHFGEVLILDWGIARIQGATLDLDFLSVSKSSNEKLHGTPLYLAPELLREGDISPAIDQYALGVILYQILTRRYPFFAKNIQSLLFKIALEDPVPPSERAPGRKIPPELEQICLKMLAKDPQQRYPSCRDVHDQLEEFLEGSREKERRQLALAACITEAQEFRQNLEAKAEQASLLREVWEDMSEQVKPWESPEKKLATWNKESAYHQAEQERISLFGKALQKYLQALAYEPDNADARKGLAELYWERFREAEEKHDTLDQIYYRDLVKLYDDGTFTQLLEGERRLQLETTPAGAEALLFRYDEEHRRLADSFVKHGGQTPIGLELPVGSYLLKVRLDGFRETLVPVSIQRGLDQALHVQLYTDDEIGAAYIHIPAGSFTFGGDPKASMSLPEEEVFVDDFFISRYPVTFEEYLEFVNELKLSSPEQARALLPRSGEEVYVRLNDEDLYVPDRSTLFHGRIAERYADGQEWTLPIFGVSWFDAVLYCRWRSSKEGRLVTLPTEQQWEKAAGGVDRRIYPWGNLFDHSFCKMGRSRPPEELQPEPVGVFSYDTSPYQMSDVVGTISEWMLSFPQHDVDQMQEDPKKTPIQRGGGWVSAREELLRIRARGPRPEGRGSYNAGFRVVAFPKKNSTNHKKSV